MNDANWERTTDAIRTGGWRTEPPYRRVWREMAWNGRIEIRDAGNLKYELAFVENEVEIAVQQVSCSDPEWSEIDERFGRTVTSSRDSAVRKFFAVRELPDE